MSKNKINIDFKKLCDIMMWERFNKESFQDVFMRQNINVSNIPHAKLVDVVHAGSLEFWAQKQKFKSKEELQKEVLNILRMAVVNPINNNKPMQESFPPIYNFCVYANRTDKLGKLTAEAEKVAEIAWYGELAKMRLKEKTDKIFSVKPDSNKYVEASKKLKQIWGFSDVEVDAFRYFICQARHEGHNPSMNKSLYLSSTKKKTGKTTVARAIASILNGEMTIEKGTKFESSFNQELQIGNHDLPMAVQYNCVILDEAMPKDSRKSYGRVKSMLTSNSCTYNQKYGRIISVEANRFYIYTSNDDISDFVQDSSERRFIQINMGKVPKQLSFEQIYDIWKEFAQHCTPEQNWQDWYNTFEDVVGIESKDIELFRDELISNKEIIQSVVSNSGYTLTLKFFTDKMITGKPTRDERDTLKKALIELVGEPKGYRWNKRELEEKLQNAINEQENEDVVSELVSNDDMNDGLPFGNYNN